MSVPPPQLPNPTFPTDQPNAKREEMFAQMLMRSKAERSEHLTVTMPKLQQSWVLKLTKPALFDTVKSEKRQMKQWWKKYYKKSPLIWCGVAQLVARRLAVRQARVRFSARHHREGLPTELSSDEEMERGPSEWWRINVLYEWLNECMYMKNKQKEWHPATKPYIIFELGKSLIKGQNN